MNKLPISVIILTYNEENNITDCLNSIYDWADEIFVVDSGSTDRTMEIIKRYTDKLYQHPFENFARQRNWAQGSLPIKNEWVLHLDADERISPELLSELKRIFSSSFIDADGFMMPRRVMFRGRWIKHGDQYPVFHMRVFRKDKGRSEERLYDQHYMLSGKVLIAGGDIINIVNPDLAAFRANHRKWAKLEAREVLLNKIRISNMKYRGNPIEMKNWLRCKVYYRAPLFIRSFLYFFYRYIVRLGFLDGKEGAIYHFWQGFWFRFLVDMEIQKLRRAKSDAE